MFSQSNVLFEYCLYLLWRNVTDRSLIIFQNKSKIASMKGVIVILANWSILITEQIHYILNWSILITEQIH